MTRRHTLLALLVVLIWGVNFLAIDAGLARVPPLLFVAVRFLLVCIPAVLLVKPPRIRWWKVLLVGAFLSLGQFTLLYLAMGLGLPPGLASLVLQAQVVFTVLASALVLRERPSARGWVGIAVGVAGLATVAVSRSGAGLGVLPLVVALGAALCWGIGNTVSRWSGPAGGSALSLVVWSGLVVPVPAAALSLAVDGPDAVVAGLAQFVASPAPILSTLYTVVLGSLVGYTIWNGLLSRYPSASVAPFTLLVPVVGIAAAWLVKGEAPTVLELVGGVVMVAGLAIATLRMRRPAASVPVAVPISD
ncbi:EamA family transporter [Galbitalea sp. SE-J8]|uniref:EamA family transporter n=1 Tax=Galbitalea sp. SE-J8 TaxID=3054952 RepID=UPI00259D0BC7|nr:EamA family transporter [Galbitalea sp. SE-J8]MDM4762900.1 EamA family transporter [Galbitalea sp. SE-J8]